MDELQQKKYTKIELFVLFFISEGVVLFFFSSSEMNLHIPEVIERAEIISREIEYTLAAFDPSFSTDILPHYTSPTIDDCQFEDCIEDPFEIIRYVKGEEAAQMLEYEGDLEFILEEIQSCRAILSGRTAAADTTTAANTGQKERNVQGDAQGTEPHNSEGVA
jgi:hypothetical protein